jgi:hypothetical protein
MHCVRVYDAVVVVVRFYLCLATVLLLTRQMRALLLLGLLEQVRLHFSLHGRQKDRQDFPMRDGSSERQSHMFTSPLHQPTASSDGTCLVAAESAAMESSRYMQAILV